MEPISLIIISYVSQKFLDQFLKEEGYGRIRRCFFPETRYKNELIKVIYETIEEYEKLYPTKTTEGKFSFFYSQVLFEELNKYLFFESQKLNNESIIRKFKENPNIITPTSGELENFYSLFISKINSNRKLRMLFIRENYQSKIFDLSENLNRIENKISKLDFDLTLLKSAFLFNPDDNWFKNHCEQSIFDLGKRYTPEVNFELEVSEIFEGLGRTAQFKTIFTKRIDGLLIKGRKILNDNEEIKEHVQLLKKNFGELNQVFSQINFNSESEISFEKIESILVIVENATEAISNYYRAEESKIQKEKNEYRFYHKYGYELSNISAFESSILDFHRFIRGTVCELANNPYLVLEGEAGIGKSHMLGDTVSKRMSNNYESIFLLGQHFTTDENPWFQIFRRLQINIDSTNFLKILNERAKSHQKRIIIFIDAINEGRGKYFWTDHIHSFINEIKKYEYLGLVLSIRTSYKNLILPEDAIKTLKLVEHRLYGFRNNEYDATKLFFSNYSIQLPNIPLLNPEFQNPLFLKLFCEGINKSGQNRIPDGIQGITAIISFFVNNVNVILSKPIRFDYSNGINLVDKSISAIIKHKIDNDIHYVDYEKAIELVENVVFKYVTKRGTFLDELISEGIFSKNLFWKGHGEYEEVVYLAYERFEDHLLCKYLLERYFNLDIEFKESGNLHKYVREENDLSYNKGLIDAFSIQIPEKTGREFYDYVPHLKDKYDVVESFVESLIWRKINTINENSKKYINDFVLHYQGTNELFWETILSLTAIPRHYYNADMLHNYLSKFSMADRDVIWTQMLKDKYNWNSAVKRLIDWAWEQDDKSHISGESIKLSSITLGWFHTSTNRQLRDCSTKALVNLLQNRIDILIEVLKVFENVNDPYVYERLFAVAYGCALRTSQKNMLTELSEYIYETIFKVSEEIYPHVLLRDYARGVIEYSAYLGYDMNLEIERIRPPYNSKFVDELPTDDEIDNKFDPKEEGYWGKEKWGNTAILMSMGVEYGRRAYGDFGRYTFQSALRSWIINPNSLSNLAIQWIFEKYGYDAKKHGRFDSEIGSGRGRDSIPNERIGKKYQWLALYEMVARVSDNFNKYNHWSSSEEVEPFQGPWDPYIRDIDPTILIKKTGGFDENESLNFWWSNKSLIDWNCSNESWVKKFNDLPKIEHLISTIDHNNEEWLVLEGYPEWAEPRKIGEDKWDYPHKRLWLQIRSYIVNIDEFENLRNWAMQKDFMGRWMPESNERYEVFNREYYWSPAYQNFFNENEDESEGEIYDNKTGEYIASISIPVEGFRWEEEFDKSKEDTISFMKPSRNIFEEMGLKYSYREGEFVNSENEIICFDTSVYHRTKSLFLIKRKPFVHYLTKNNLKIIWTILGEKQILGGRTFREDYVGMLELSGAYFISDDSEITGMLNSKYR